MSVDLSEHPLFLLKPSDVVQILGVSRSWLYDAAKSGRIPCVRLGGDDGPVRFRPDEIAAWLEAGRVVPTAAVGERPAAPKRQRDVPRPRSHRPGFATAEQLGLLPRAPDA
jgi:excisionase family DNA binding protein